MNGQEYRDALKALGLNQTTGAALLDITVRSSGRYANGHLPVPPIIAMVLRLMLATGTTVEQAERYKRGES